MSDSITITIPLVEARHLLEILSVIEFPGVILALIALSNKERCFDVSDVVYRGLYTK